MDSVYPAKNNPNTLYRRQALRKIFCNFLFHILPLVPNPFDETAMHHHPLCATVALICLLTGVMNSQTILSRPPAIPLITTDPYFSIWSMSDHPGNDYTRHWTGATMSICAMVRIDGTGYRLVGKNVGSLPVLPLVTTTLSPTQTVYRFEGAGIALSMTFTVPLLPDSLDLLSSSVGYITVSVSSIDSRPHRVGLYLDHSAELCLDHPGESVAWGRVKVEGLDVLEMGSQEQPVLKRKGDDVRIDWGHIFFVATKNQNALSCIGSADEVRQLFLNAGVLPASDDMRMPRPGNDDWPVSAYVFDLGQVEKAAKQIFVMLAYDDEYPIEYFHRALPSYWRRNGGTMSDHLQAMAAAHDRLLASCDAFDRRLTSALTERGGPEYASLCALAYRQVVAAHKLVADIDGTPMLFPKENFSNGCISTVDVIYPSAPFFLAFNPELLKALLTPVFRYSEMPRWKFPFAPHDLGTYPKANGQVYGGGEQDETDQMPVEETGNMMILTYALCREAKSPAFALDHWKCVTQWAHYLEEKGLDPENQLCTDDFTGHLAHNTNLSVKAIVGLGCYGKLCALAGKTEEAKRYHDLAVRFAGQWETMASDGDHYRLAFDRPGTWSMKYNLVWDSLFDLGLFHPEIRTKELAYYRSKMNAYGLPLDNRADFTKPEWMIWTATMATDKEEFASYVRPIIAYLNATPDRVPFSDWYETKTARKDAFQARSVLGGLFIKMLSKE